MLIIWNFTGIPPQSSLIIIPAVNGVISGRFHPSADRSVGQHATCRGGRIPEFVLTSVVVKKASVVHKVCREIQHQHERLTSLICVSELKDAVAVTVAK